jgi:hypothetical protein
VSRLRVLALTEDERYRHGWSVSGGRSTQRCPCCRTTVWAPLPDPPSEVLDARDPDAIDDYHRQVLNRLNDAVFDHLDHDCPDTRKEESR